MNSNVFQLPRYISSRLRRLRLLVLVVVAVMVSGMVGLEACQVPVFRYAFERWNSDAYEIVVLANDDVSQELDAMVEVMKRKATGNANAKVTLTSLAELSAKKRAAIESLSSTTRPVRMALFYPANASGLRDKLVDILPAKPDSIATLFDSPKRSEVTSRLSNGESAVWLFLPGKDTERSDRALKRLELALLASESRVKLPALDEIDVSKSEVQEQVSRLRVDFSALALSRSDPAEQWLISMLLKSEDDLAELDEPMAFPVFGRGRVLYALVGDGINEENIFQACQFIVGPCSCQVKAQNPGFDLLIRYDWEMAVGDVKLSDPLPGNDGEPALVPIPKGRKAKP